MIALSSDHNYILPYCENIGLISFLLYILIQTITIFYVVNLSEPVSKVTMSNSCSIITPKHPNSCNAKTGQFYPSHKQG